jgi:subtilase family serine protease
MIAVQGSAWVPADGAYYLGAVVDPQNNLQELIEDNNATAGNRMGVGNKPDLVVASVEGPASAQMGDSITAWVTVCNQGTQSGSAPLELYLSPDTTITPNGPNGPSPDFFFGYASLPVLDPGQCQTLAVQNPAWVPTDGAYYLGAVIDPQNGLPELIENNNATAGTRMGVGSKPDFTVSSASGPASALPGQAITASVTVCNQGTQPGSAPVEVYLSSDATITPNGPNGPSPDFFLGYASTATLVPGQCQTVSVSGNAYVPSEGVYFIGAVVDPQNGVQELIEDNNTQASNRIGIGSKPDFTVSSVSSVSSVHLGQSLTATVKVCNQGTQAASAPLEVYLSTDTTLTPNGPMGPSPDSFLGYASTATLNPGQCQTLYVTGPASVPMAGAYYLGAVVDPQNGFPELFEDNNSKVGTFVSVTP